MIKNTCNTVITELKKFTSKAILKAGYSEQTAEYCTNATIKCIQLNFKNRLIYIPCFNQRKKFEEKQKIRIDFNGSNHDELAIKYQRCMQSIYAILRSKNIKNPKPAILIQVLEDYLPIKLINIGLSEETAKTIAKDIADHLQQTFPGISIYFSEQIISVPLLIVPVAITSLQESS